MECKPRLSPYNMVLWVLKAENGGFLSIKQIRAKVFSEMAYSIAKETVVAAIDQAKYVSGNIQERTERRGLKKVTVKVFAIIAKAENSNTKTA